jgi:hypothetical protein
MILPGPQRSELVAQDFRSTVALGRLRKSLGESFAGLTLSAREVDGGGHNRLLGPDFLWKRSATDKIFGQLLVSSTENPNRPDLSAQFQGQSFDGHAYRVVFQRDAKRYDIWAATSGYSPGFRADNGFIVQNDLRRAGLWSGLRFYPKRFFSYLRPYAGSELDMRFDGSETLRHGIYDGFEFEGKWGSSGWVTAGYERERVGSKLLAKKQVDFNLRAVPHRWLPAIQLDGIAGERIDYAGGRVGTGAVLNLSGTLRATDHLELQLRTSREWLDLADDGRLFTAKIDWVKATYTFSPRTMVRAIVQDSTIERRDADPDRQLSLSALFGYKLNWQTVFFIGYGDASITDDRGQLTRTARSLFTKVAYAFQR